MQHIISHNTLINVSIKKNLFLNLHITDGNIVESKKYESDSNPTRIQFYFYESFFTVDRLLCNLRTDSSNKSIQSRPFSSKKLATDFLKVVSRLAPVLPSLNTNTRSYWSSNLKNKHHKMKLKLHI